MDNDLRAHTGPTEQQQQLLQEKERVWDRSRRAAGPFPAVLVMFGSKGKPENSRNAQAAAAGADARPASGLTLWRVRLFALVV
jgi:hypothetical protein